MGEREEIEKRRLAEPVIAEAFGPLRTFTGLYINTLEEQDRARLAQLAKVAGDAMVEKKATGEESVLALCVLLFYVLEDVIGMGPMPEKRLTEADITRLLREES